MQPFLAAFSCFMRYLFLKYINMEYRLTQNEHFTIKSGQSEINIDEIKDYIDTKVGDIETLLASI